MFIIEKTHILCFIEKISLIFDFFCILFFLFHFLRRFLNQTYSRIHKQKLNEVALFLEPYWKISLKFIANHWQWKQWSPVLTSPGIFTWSDAKEHRLLYGLHISLYEWYEYGYMRANTTIYCIFEEDHKNFYVCFILIYDLKSFQCWVNGHLPSLGSFQDASWDAFVLYFRLSWSKSIFRK